MLQIYNTMTATKEEFKPVRKGSVHIYVCGVTVYDLCHIGHARSAVAFDVVRRTFLWLGYNVKFVKNFTDIDDKIIKKSNETHTDWHEITAKYIHEHNVDMESLRVLPPDRTPLATEYIPQMISFCQRLIDKGYAYVVDGDIYYRVTKFEEYGKLSNRNIDDLLSGARVDINEKKENPLDFALWKAAKPGEPSWESPWGAGRPGWHLECSVMSEEILGLPLDIHGGGQDLTFPHHENEIAQSEAACGCTLANYWMHNGFVNINKEKMSKSLGNFFTIKDILKDFDPEVLRFFLLTTHYRQPLEFADSKLIEAESSLGRIYTFKDELEHYQPTNKGKDFPAEIAQIKTDFDNDFKNAIMDDFNTSAAMAALFDAVRAGNKLLTEKLNSAGVDALKKVSNGIFNTVDLVLGAVYRSPKEWFDANLTIEKPKLQEMIDQRNQARKDKNFELADSIRQELSKSGVELIDTATGTRYRTKKVR